MQTRLLATAGLVVTTFASASSIAGQDPQPPRPSTGSGRPELVEGREPFRTEVNYIRVDMYPTAKGAPVTDLLQTEVEILDEGVPQKIVQFEHVLIRGARSQEVRREPTSVSEMRQAARDSRARLFVLFLDTNHVEPGAAIQVSKPLSTALNGLIGGDDLIAVMTPEMSASDLTFTRRTTAIEELLKQRWAQRDRPVMTDPVEDQYATCYPALPMKPGAQASDRGIAQEMILRRREKQTLDALENLVRHLGAVREERKAVITVSAGWRLYRENAALRRPIGNPQPPAPIVAVDPRTGKLSTTELPFLGIATASCERDRVALSMLENEMRFLRILDEANRANTSFYPLDPRGLVVFDENIVPVAGVGTGLNANPAVDLQEDQARLHARNTSLRVLAENTDGVAIVQTSDIAAGLRRMADDLSSYYLIGYYSTEKLDGKFHRITVRVKRPGVQVRARRGYLAGTAAASTSRGTGIAKPASESAEARAVAAPLASLAVFTRERPLRAQVAAGWTPGGPATMWVVAEVPTASGPHEWSQGGQAEVTLIDSTGATVTTERVEITPGMSSVRIALGRGSLAPDDYQVQIRARGARATMAATETVRVSLPATPNGVGVLFSRRGITTGNRDVPTADLRFRRTERITLQVPTPSSDTPSARLLDRMGRPLAIPLTAAIRDDADGSRWITTQLALAPLAAGDYVIELTAGAPNSHPTAQSPRGGGPGAAAALGWPAGSQPTLAAFRVLP